LAQRPTAQLTLITPTDVTRESTIRTANAV
jgi:hypothetical protein